MAVQLNRHWSCGMDKNYNQCKIMDVICIYFLILAKPC